MEDKKIFSDFEQVDCNDCSHYWDDSCGGVKKGTEKRCTAFLATRKVDIPLEIKALRERVKWLRISGLLVNIVVVIHLITHILGWE